MIYFLCVILTVIIFILCIRIYLFEKSLKEINEDLEEILLQNLDTNSLLTVSSGSHHIRRLAAQLNRQLIKLRQEHLRYENGDRELREAITNVSHDLRTPLTAICGYLDLIRKGLTDQTSLRYLEIIRNRTEAMKQLTSELFCYSVALSEKEKLLTVLSLNRVLEECLISFCSELKQRSIVPVVSMPEEIVYRTLDESSLTRIFNNIISNAVKYSDGDLRVALTPEGAVIFSNKARHLTPVTTAKLFDRFFTVETVGSTGLGLSIAKLLTERMGGAISAEYGNGELHITVQFP